MTTALETRTEHIPGPLDVAFRVDVVDSIGRGVSTIPIEVVYELGDGSAIVTRHRTDIDGTAMIGDHLPAPANAIEFEVGRERSGPHTTFLQSTFVIEM